MTIPLAVTEALFLAGGVPLFRAWLANRRTTLLQALIWTAAAWLAWAGTAAAELLARPSTADVSRYVALSLTGCAGVAVLGARRPGVGAWNFVVVGLLAVALLPLAEAQITGGALHLAGPRLFFLAGTLLVLVLNYLPTVLGPAALAVALGCALHLLPLRGAESIRLPVGWWSLPVLAAPWLGWYGVWKRPPAASAFDAVWLDFRDRFGLLWGQRMREQFNRSAAHAGWQVYLRWGGLRIQPGAERPDGAAQAEMVRVLRALLQRFQSEATLPERLR